MKNLFVFILSILFCSMLSGQSVWERTFSKPNHNFQDYSITVAKDGSNDLVLAGTLIDQNTNQHLIHILKIDDITATIIFEKTYSPGTDSWAMSICSFSAAAGSGYGVTGFTDLLGVRYPIIITFDETGQEINNQIITTGTQNGMGLHIQATPDATNEGFVVVGLVHDAINTVLNSTQRQSFCLKVNQSLNLEWEKYFDSPLSSLYSNDYDGASFVVPTDQGYFITGGKNILNVIGQHRQGILALMLDANGNQLWDESFFLGNIFDNGASAYYDQNNQEVYVLFNNSAFHHLGIGVFDATLGTFNNATSIQASSSDFSLDKYGHTLIKTPFADNLLIYGRALDPVKGQPAFLVDYDISTKQFGVHHSESNTSSTLNQTPSTEPFPTAALRSLHYPQSLVNIDANFSAYISYVGDTNEPASLVVRKFEHLTEEEYNFCEPSDAILVDDTGNINRNVGVALEFSAFTSNFSNQSITENIEITANADFCSPPMDPSIDPFIKVVGDTLPDHYNKIKRIGNYLYAAGSTGEPNTNAAQAVFSQFDLTGNLLWTTRLTTPSVFNDFVETDNSEDEFLIVGRSEPIRVGNTWQDNESIICKIDINGNILLINHFQQVGRENMINIIRHPNPSDSSNPFYISGVENETGTNPSSFDFVNVYNLNASCTINWKYQYSSNTDNEFVRTLVPLSNGNVGLFGKTLSQRAIGVIINSAGIVVDDFEIDDTFSNNNSLDIRDAIEIPNSTDFYIVGYLITTSNAFIARVNDHGNEIWSYRMGTQTRFDQIKIGPDGNLYVIGIGDTDGDPSIAGVNRYLVNRFSPTGQLQWSRYIEKGGETAFERGELDILSEGYIAYADCRTDHPNGFGGFDALVGVLDLEFSSECTFDFPETVTDSFFLVTSPVTVIRETSTYPFTQNTEADAVTLQCGEGCEESVQIDPFIKIVGDTLPDHYNKIKRIGNYLYAAGSTGEPNTNAAQAVFSQFDLTGNLLWTTRLTTPSVFNDFVETDNNEDEFLIVGRSEPIRVGNSWQDNESIICKIDIAGNILFINHFQQVGRENLINIIRHPNPDPNDPSNPFYISGVENETGTNPSTLDFVNVYNLNASGVINWKYQYSNTTGDNEFVRTLVPLSNGNVALFGKTLSQRAIGVIINSAGVVVDDFEIDDTFSNNNSLDIRDAIEIPNSTDFYIVGYLITTSDAFIARINDHGNEIWSYRMGTQTRFDQIKIGPDGNLYVIGIGDTDGDPSIAGVNRYLVNRFSPTGQLQWSRYIEKFGETAYERGELDILSEGYIAYSDCRTDHPNGFGGFDAFVGVLDLEFSSECTFDFPETVIDSFFLVTSPVVVSGETSPYPFTQNMEADAVTFHCDEGCEELIQIDTFLKLAGDTLSNRPTRIKRVGDYLYVTGTIGTSPNISGTFSQFDLNGGLNWTVSLDTASVLVDFVPMDDDGNAFLVVGRSEPIGNGGGNNWQDNESILCAITNLGVVSWVENFTQNGREFFTRIVRSTDPNPPTPNPNAPFYIIGAENPFNPSSRDRTVVINVNVNGQVIWKNHYYTFNNDTELYKDAIPLANGDIALFGDYRNNAGSAYVGGAMVITPSGAIVAGQNFGLTNDQYINTAVEVNGSTDFLVAGEDVSTGQAFLGRVTNTGTSVWALTVANQQSFRTVKEGTDGNIYVLGRSRALFGEITRNYMNCFTIDSNGVPTLNWTRHIRDDNETAYSLGHFDILQEGKIAYTDGRIDNPVGAGDYDILVSVSSLNFNDSPCMRDTVETFTGFNFGNDMPNTVVTADMPNTNIMGQGITLDYLCATPCGVTPPLPCEIICPDDIMVNNDSGLCSADVTLTPPTLIGDCSDWSLISAPFQTTFPVGCTTATWTYQSASTGLQQNCSIQVCVTDNEPPVVTCTDITAPVGNGPFTIIPLWAGFATDNCPNLAVSIDQNTFDCSQRGTIVPVTFTATDASGNVSQCISNVSVVDLVPPTLLCLIDVTVNCDVDFNDPNNTGGYPIANDICDPNPTISFIDNVSIGDPCNIVIQRDWIATDDSGNVSATCTQMINVIDDTPPVVTNCPVDMTIQVVQDMNGTCMSSMMLPLPTVVDDCSNYIINFTMVGASVESGTYVGNNLNFFEGTTNVTLTAIDDCGNSTFACQYDVTVECVAFCPNNVIQNGDFEMGTPTMNPSDDEDINLATNWGGIWNINNPNPLPNNFSTGDFYNMTTALPPAVVSLPFPPTQSQYGTFWVGNGGNPIYREGIMNQLAFPLVQGNENCQLEMKIACLAGFGTPTLNVYGVNAPNGFNSGTIMSATMPTNPSIFGTNPVYFLDSYQIDTATCDSNFMTITLNFNSSILPAGGIDHIFFTRADATQGRQFIAIDDVCLAKVDDCVADFNWNIVDDCGTIQFTDASTSATNIVSWNYYEQQTSIFNVTGQNPLVNLVLAGNYTVCLDIVTASGCTSTLCQSFNVPIDQTPPVITCPNDATISCNQNPDPILTGSATATDDFDLFPTITYVDNFSIGDPCDILLQRTWTATDACGNSTMCTQNINIIDDIAPKFVSCTPDIVVQGTGSFTEPCMATVSVPNPIAKDGCNPNAPIIYEYVLSDAISGSGIGPIVNMDFPVGTTTITWSATDACGNTIVICVSNVVVNPCEPCTISCPENITVNSDFEQCDAFVNVPSPNLTGDCFGCEWTNDYNGTSDASDTYPVGCTSVIFSTTNCPNNLPLSCSVTICVEDNQLPQIDCPDDITVQTTNTTGSVVTWLPIFGTDNCPLIVDCSMNSGDFFPCGTTTVTCTITEAYTGNTTTCNFNVTVICVNSTCSPCPDNILTNSDFQSGAVVGSLSGAGAVNNWQDNTKSPQVISGDFCGDPFAIQMWGNQDVGESIIQNGVNIKSGYKYRVTFCGRYVPQPTLPTNYIQFGFTASNGSVDPFTVPNNMGASTVGQITSSAWSCYTLPLWTADQNYTDVIINAFNANSNIQGDATTVSWGRIDNICIEELDVCTLDCPDDMLVNNDPGQCGAMVTVPVPELLGDCAGCGIINDFNGDADASGFYPVGCTNVTWSLICAGTPFVAQCSAEICVVDNEPPGPPCPSDITVTVPQGSTGSIVNYFIAVSDNCPGVAVVNPTPPPSQSGDFYPLGCTTINMESVDASLNTTPCSFQICVAEEMPPVCECDGWETLSFGFLGQFPLEKPVECNNMDPVELNCPEKIDEFYFHGNFNCTDACGGDVDWEIIEDGSTTATSSGTVIGSNGGAGNSYHFDINSIPYPLAGSYKLKLQSTCGSDTCVCEVAFIMPECNPECVCENPIIPAAPASIITAYHLSGCNNVLTPSFFLEDECDEITWRFRPPGQVAFTTIGVSQGNDPITYNFQTTGSGTYQICMQVKRTLADGTICEEEERCQKVKIKCGPPTISCVDPLINNSGFTEGTTPGILGNGGSTQGWEASFGAPEILDTEGCVDQYAVAISGNKVEADGLSTQVELMGAEEYALEMCMSVTGELHENSWISVRISDNPQDGLNCTGLCEEVVRLSVCCIVDTIPIWITFPIEDVDLNEGTKYLTFHVENESAEFKSTVVLDGICLEPFEYIYVGTENFFTQNEVKIFPNPTSEDVFIQFSEVLEDDLNYRVIDMWGRVLQSGTFEKGYPTHTVEMMNYAEGIYIIEMGNGETGFYRERIVKHTP